MDVLVLNSDSNPLSIIPLSAINWQECVKLIYLRKVIEVAHYENWIVHSVNSEMVLPSVVMTRKFIKETNKIKFTKHNLYYRDEGTCQYCGKFDTINNQTVDHVKPKSMGGHRVWDNTVIACSQCNGSRGNNISIQPMKKPKKPAYYEIMTKRKKFPIYLRHPSWNDFLNWDPALLIDKPTSMGQFSLDIKTL